MLIHGGFWRARYDLRLEDQLVADLAGRGWAAWNLEYRRLGWRSRGGWPATFEDVAAGIDLLGRLDESLDLARVIAIGHSAGGHLALWAAARRGLRRWRAFAILMTLVVLAVAALLAAWKFVPERVPPMLQPIEVLRQVGVELPSAGRARRPVPPPSQLEE